MNHIHDMRAQQPEPFGKLRSFFWPIYRYELRKLLPMFCLFFLISFVYNLLRCMKIALVVTAEGSGAEAIPYLKVWAVLPGAFLLTYIFTRLANRLNREQLFYCMLGLFLSFFACFLFFLYPNRQELELTRLANFLQAVLPEGFRGLIAIVRHWTLSLFYVLSELWSTVILSMLFWGFANEVTSVDEAKRFYAIFAFGANCSGIFSGQFAQLMSLQAYHPNLPFGHNAWEQSLVLLLGSVLICGAVIIVLFRWLNRNVLVGKLAHQPITVKKEKNSVTLMECFRYLAKSRYMLYIAIIVVAYNVVYNLSDVLWTDQVQHRYPDTRELNAYMNQVTSITGIIAALSALIISGNVIRRFGWTVAALITPIIWLMTSSGFFSCLLFEKTFLGDVLYQLFQMPMNSLIILFGSAQICLGRASKYTVFDETKEIAFVPLSRENQRKGKAVVDGIASRLGKSGGSLIFQVLFLLCANISVTIPYVAGIISIMIALWIFAVLALGRLVNRSIDQEMEGVDPSIDKQAKAQGAAQQVVHSSAVGTG